MEAKTESTNKLSSTLKYLPDTIEGYTRTSKGKGFAYYFKGELVKDENLIKRFHSLVIPPAWKNVWISPSKNGHLQATGIDVKGRKQYIYHPEWQQMQHKNKFARIIEFGKSLPRSEEHTSELQSRENLVCR